MKQIKVTIWGQIYFLSENICLATVPIFLCGMSLQSYRLYEFRENQAHRHP